MKISVAVSLPLIAKVEVSYQCHFQRQSGQRQQAEVRRPRTASQGAAFRRGPGDGVEAAVELYGVHATTALAHCALGAYVDRREADHEFWFRIFAQLKGIPLSDSKH
ncbi:hypothetical protein [Ensifer aridi]|uniref:hypothetical protein n=1 Tax=Ensifer aridi TaxID=1708715 RepID=UPI001FCDEDEB|nr:hypothetical protein [Ensifer aridi]